MATLKRSVQPYQFILWADVAFELAAAIILFFARGPLADWFGLDTWALVAASAAFVAAAIGVGAIALWPTETAVRLLAVANASGAIALWLVIALGWGELEPQGRWVLFAAANTFAVLGAGEWMLLRGVRRD